MSDTLNTFTSLPISPQCIIDTHCHIDFSAFDQDRESILQQCAAQHINTLVIPGVHAGQWPSLLQLLEKPSPIKLLGALGMHPLFKEKHHLSHLKDLEQYVNQNPASIVAIGEIGLDFYQGMYEANVQVALFNAQLELAKQLNKPVIIHSRKAHDVVCKHLRHTAFTRGGIIHAFSGSLQQAEAFVSLGFYLGIGGSITYPRAKKLRTIVSTLPLTSFVLETDAPDMPLSGQQGKRNTPTHLPLVLDEFCALRPESREIITRQLYVNSCQALQLH